MRQVRFFELEQHTGRGGDDRVLLIGIMDSDGNPAVDGGRREAVRRATRGDVERYAEAYAEYYQSYSQAPAPPAQQPGQQPTPPGSSPGAGSQPATEAPSWSAA